MVDVKTLELLADRMEKDARAGVHRLSGSAMLSIADIIRAAIGAPLMWPSRDAGVRFADEFYSGTPTSRMAFNHGVKWAVERYVLDNEGAVRLRHE